MIKKQGGYSLIPVTVGLAILAILSAILMTIVVAQSKQALSQENTIKAYYVSESGIVKAISYIRDNCLYKTPKENNSPVIIKSNKKGKPLPSSVVSDGKDKNINSNGNGYAYGKGKFKPKKNNSTEEPETYTLVKEQKEIPFESEYVKKYIVKWKVEQIQGTNFYGVTSTGQYGKAISTTEALIEVKEDQTINVIYYIQK